jgi:hypothetical protein
MAWGRCIIWDRGGGSSWIFTFDPERTSRSDAALICFEPNLPNAAHCMESCNLSKRIITNKKTAYMYPSRIKLDE